MGTMRTIAMTLALCACAEEEPRTCGVGSYDATRVACYLGDEEVNCEVDAAAPGFGLCEPDGRPPCSSLDGCAPQGCVEGECRCLIDGAEGKLVAYCIE